jgi:hypothetical protein
MEAEGLMPELDDIMAQLEAKYGRQLPHGYNPNLHFMSHLWEPLRHMYRCADRVDVLMVAVPSEPLVGSPNGRRSWCNIRLLTG